MRRDDPFEITHIPGRLRTAFTGRLPEAKTGSSAEREANFLSRALAALAIYKLAECDLQEAADAVVDGGGDGGIDAIYYAETTNVLWVAQSKYHSNGRGEPDLGSVLKFKEGLENLLNGRFAAFESNDAWRPILPKVRLAFNNNALQVRAFLVYSGINIVSEDRNRLFRALEAEYSPDSDYLRITTYNLTTVHGWATGDDEEEREVEEALLRLIKPGWIKAPYETMYGLIALADIAALYQEHRKALVGANIRGYKGSTAVNEQIVTTLRERPEQFFYLNNGLTAYCRRLEVPPLERPKADEKRIRVFGFSIVNGAQTLGSILHYSSEMAEPIPDGYVFLKIISLERCEDDRGFAKLITRSTNFQNQIGPRDFIALDEQQERIAAQLAASGISYYYKDDIDAPEPDETSFTLAEATTACAAMTDSSDCDLSARILANRRSLWSLEDIYPRLFHHDLSPRDLWRAVQVQRVVRAALRSGETGVRKEFFDHCRWLVLSLIFLRLRSHQGAALTLSGHEQEQITKAAQDYAERLWSACESKGLVAARASGGWEAPRHFRSVFSAVGDCQLLRAAVLKSLADSPPA